METNTKMINKVISTNTNTSWLKIIALITMTCDHIGKMFFPKITILQIVGRIAFPLFAYCLAVGCIYTHDIKKYASRLLLFAIISQPFYIMRFSANINQFIDNLTNFNIFFTLFIGVLTIWSIRDKRWIALGLCLLFAAFVNIDYGLAGIVLIITFYIFISKQKILFILVALQLGMYFIYPGDVEFFGIKVNLQGFSLLAIPFIFAKERKKCEIKVNKYFFYIYYPVHFIILTLLKQILM
ncbi:TraX family protein [Intestinibacter bartlettii]|uniref:TraX family protein n=1 Tax=Intestinibacter bartlettii TaxID=261299 RepID=UPI0026771E95|nr:TraX family protein [Intestinibacter bartlettii]